MGVEVVADLIILHLCLRYIPSDKSDYHETFRRFCKDKAVWVACFGVMLRQSVAFWPKCHLCEFPYECLLFTECLKNGFFLHNGTDLCYTSFIFNSHVAAHLRAATGLSPVDLGCNRTDLAASCGDGTWGLA